MHTKLLVFAATAALALPAASQTIPPAAQQAADSINPEHMRAHVRFLSSDLLEGRGPGTRGDQLAAEYIATQFALNGLQPAGDNGTYFQKVPLYAVHTLDDKTTFSLIPKNGAPIQLAYNTDIVAKDQTGQATADIDAPVVFAGYGIHAPEYNWDDYKGVDVKGKVVIVIVNEPPSTDEKFFKGRAMTYYGRWTYKYEEASRRGAIAVLIIHRTDLASYGWQVVRDSQIIEKSYLEGDPLATLRAAAWIQHDVAQKLLTTIHGSNTAGSIDDVIDRAGKPGFHAIELPVRLKAHIESRVRRYISTNVVAKVPGATSGGNAVLYTAHYDHLGINPDAKGDGIYNGAADNGTGCGILIELSRAFAQSTLAPPHDIYFAAVTAEEQGLLGSQYLGMHPPVPASQITLDLNYDMLLPVGIPRSVSLGGAERINFWPTVQSVAKQFDLELLPDPTPGAGHYYRSDHFSLARVGIPAFSVDQGELFEGHDEAWGRALESDYNTHHYHQPSDEYDPKWDFRGNAKLARFGFVLGWIASEQPTAIQWNPGDEFESARKQSRK
jgi:Zn-dependent M28 family amino/carboxypeptidase